jgi:hypothetical protein
MAALWFNDDGFNTWRRAVTSPSSAEHDVQSVVRTRRASCCAAARHEGRQRNKALARSRARLGVSDGDEGPCEVSAMEMRCQRCLGVSDGDEGPCEEGLLGFGSSRCQRWR